MEILWSIGLQSRKGMTFGDAPDMEGIALLAEKYGMKDVVIFGKDHTGFCFHPTKVGYPLQDLTHDLTGELTAALHRHKIKAIAYTCFGLDGEAGRHHPEWLREKSPGVPLEVTPDSWAYMCPFGGYLENYLMPVVMEMIEKYSMDGFFFDTMGASGYCACKSCRDAFHRDTGLTLPSKENPEDPAWDVYGPWQYKCVEKMFLDVRRQIEAARPGTQVLINHDCHAWSCRVAPDVLKVKLSADPAVFYPNLSVTANYGASFPVTGEVFIEHYARGWGDRNECTDLTVQHKSAVIFGHRQDFRVGDRLQTQWRVARGSDHVLSIISKTKKCFEKELTADLVKEPDDLVLVPESYYTGFRKKGLQRKQNQSHKLLPGIYKLLVDCGRNFQLVMEATLPLFLNPKRNLILAGCEYLRPETEALIRDFVRQGGHLLMTEKVPLAEDGTPVCWSGIRSIEYSKAKNLAAVYLPDLGSCKRLPNGEYPLLQSNMAAVTMNGAKVALRAYPQVYRKLFLDAIFSYYLSSEDKPMDDPLLTEFQFGKGKVFFLNCAYFTDYNMSPLPIYKKWMENLLYKVFPKSSNQLLSPAGDVEHIVYGNEKRSVHLLLNHGGRRAGSYFPGYSEQIIEPQPVYVVTLKLKEEGHPLVRINGKKVSYQRKGKYILVPVVMDSLWKFVHVDRKS